MSNLMGFRQLSLFVFPLLAMACGNKAPSPPPVTAQSAAGAPATPAATPPAEPATAPAAKPEPTPAADPTPTPGAAPTPTPEVAPTPAPAADSAPPPSGGAAGLSSLFGPHFVADAQPLDFVWTYKVADTSDAEAKGDELSATVRCNSNPSRMGEAFLVSMTCTVVGAIKGSETLDPEPTLSRTWVATAEGLWQATDTSPSAIADLLKTKPFLTSAPVKYESTTEYDAEKDVPGRSESVSQDGAAWCREDSEDGIHGMVGSSWCFAPERGLIKVGMTGRTGPSSETYIRK